MDVDGNIPQDMIKAISHYPEGVVHLHSAQGLPRVYAPEQFYGNYIEYSQSMKTSGSEAFPKSDTDTLPLVESCYECYKNFPLNRSNRGPFSLPPYRDCRVQNQHEHENWSSTAFRDGYTFQWKECTYRYTPTILNPSPCLPFFGTVLQEHGLAQQGYQPLLHSGMET